MEFKRDIYHDLLEWKTKAKRKPLLLMGARQIGKTTLLKSFGKEEYDNTLYLNLERQPDVHSFFTKNKEPQAIIDRLSLIHGQAIEARTTLIILDEIQECRDALIALKYFQEELPDIHIAAAGSLLGLTIGNDRSFPVGKVEFMDMYPLSFSEYLEASDIKKYNAFHHYLKADEIGQIPDVFFNQLHAVFKEYLLFAGMPEVASDIIENKDVSQAQELQDQILRAYELDFVKHADGATKTKIQHVWNSLPSQLSKENKKFLFKAIRTGARAREYETAIQWLVQAGLVYKHPKVEKIAIPLKAYEDISAFKIYCFETGILMRMAGLDHRTFVDGDQFFTEFKGSLAENYVAQSLKKIFGRSPAYWTSEGKAEVDFIIEHKGHCIPVEVKSGTSTKAKSLSVYKELYAPKIRIRVSNLNLNKTDDLLNIPLFYAEYIDVLIDKI